MAVRLGVVAQRAFRDGVVLLREQSGRTRCRDQLIEQCLCLQALSDQQVGLDEPGGAEVEPTFDAGQTVVVMVSVYR